MAMSPEMQAKLEEKKRREAEEYRAKQAAAAPTEPPVEEMAMGEEYQAPELLDPEPEPAPEPETPYDRFVASLPEEVREILSEEDLRAAYAQAEHDAREERRRKLAATAKRKAIAAARAATGLITPEEAEAEALAEKNDRMVKITPRLPFIGDSGGVASDGVVIDGTKYEHGQTYTVPYARALSIRDILYRMHQHEMDFEGKSRLNGLRQQHASDVNVSRM